MSSTRDLYNASSILRIISLPMEVEFESPRAYHFLSYSWHVLDPSLNRLPFRISFRYCTELPASRVVKNCS